MKLNEALDKELNRGMGIIAATADAKCNSCGATDELRAGACYDCKDLVETDMIDVWLVSDPSRRWPYSWRGERFIDISEADAAKLQSVISQGAS